MKPRINNENIYPELDIKTGIIKLGGHTEYLAQIVTFARFKHNDKYYFQEFLSRGMSTDSLGEALKQAVKPIIIDVHLASEFRTLNTSLFDQLYIEDKGEALEESVRLEYEYKL